jgi:RHS repeat-associated protein
MTSAETDPKTASEKRSLKSSPSSWEEARQTRRTRLSSHDNNTLKQCVTGTRWFENFARTSDSRTEAGSASITAAALPSILGRDASGGADATDGTVYSLSPITYSGDGDVTSGNDSVNGNWSYTYDGFNRLASASKSGLSLTFAYDRFGNRWQQNSSGQGSVSLSFDGANRITNLGYVYDAAGNLLMDNVNCYSYDAENRLVAVAPETSPGSDVCGAVTMTYLYDPDGRRVAKLQNGSIVKQYYYDAAGQMIEAADGSGSVLRAEFYAGSRHLATWTANATYFNHADWLGTERLRTFGSGSKIGEACEQITSLPYGDGEATQSENGGCGDPSPNHFTGKERDSESNLDYFGARYNSSSAGRFTSPDPLLSSGQPWNPQTWDRYTYALNNPLAITDPTGLYNLVNTCAQDDKKCNKRFRSYARDLRNELKDLQKDADKMKGGTEKSRLEAALGALGTENDKNNVNLSFGPLPGNAAGDTQTNYDSKSGGLTFDVTLDPTKNADIGWGVNAAHEGTHVADISDPRYANSATTLSQFQLEYRGYETSAWAARALGASNWAPGGNVIWNESWKAQDRQTLMDRGITREVTGPEYGHKETIPHNPWPN